MKRGATLLALAAALAMQLAWHGWAPRAQALAAPLAAPPSMAAARLGSLGDPVAASRLLMLYVQAHDDQATGPLTLRELDYGTVRAWLARVLELDPRSQYPLLAASEVYAAVNDPARVRVMLDFVQREFARDPARRWPWMAQAALVARHRLHDLPLAQTYARELRTRAPGAPPWARELEGLFAEDAGELATARAVLGGLISSGQVTDPNELRFLERRLQALEAQGK